MPQSVQLFSPTVPAGTLQSAPVTIPIAVGMATVNRVRWRVPPGPRGNLGWYLAMGGVQVVPDGNGLYIVADDDGDTWDLTPLPDEGEWELIGYNTGQFAHSVYLWFYTTPIQLTGPGAPPVVIPAAALAGP